MGDLDPHWRAAARRSILASQQRVVGEGGAGELAREEGVPIWSTGR
jgi:hypothetical protein